MAWTFTTDIEAYRDAADALLTAQPVRHTVLLSVLGNLVRIGAGVFGDEPPLCGWWSQGGIARAAVLQTPPYPMLVTALPGSAASQLAGALADRRATLSAVNGAEPDVSAFASAWSQVTGRRGMVSQRQRLYQLGELVTPEPWPDGAARVASRADRAVVMSLHDGFSAETGQSGSGARLVDDRLAERQLMLWEVAGAPAAMAGMTAVICGVARVGPVYTPPELRGRGYGAAVTAAITQLAIDRGAQTVVLFTDLANPTSNSIYLRLGYRPVEDRLILNFIH